jgi:tetratricopeptide (TPR) repeat protein
VFYYNHSDYEQAIPFFRLATELAPDNPVAFYSLGGIYVNQGKYQEAETILRRAIAIEPTAQAYSNLGAALLAGGRYADSVAMLKKSVELAPDDHRYWFNLGNAYALMEDRDKSGQAYERAVREAEKSLTLKPKDGELLERLALYYAILGDKAKAQFALAQVPPPFASEPATLFQSAQVFEFIGQRDQALKAIRSALLAGYPLSEIEKTSMFADLRTDPGYRKMIDGRAPAKPSVQGQH